MLLRCESPEPRMSQSGHSLQVRPDRLSTNVRFPSNTDRKFSALGFVAMRQKRLQQSAARLFDHLVG